MSPLRSPPILPAERVPPAARRAVRLGGPRVGAWGRSGSRTGGAAWGFRGGRGGQGGIRRADWTHVQGRERGRQSNQPGLQADQCGGDALCGGHDICAESIVVLWAKAGSRRISRNISSSAPFSASRSVGLAADLFPDLHLFFSAAAGGRRTGAEAPHVEEAFPRPARRGRDSTGT